MLLRSLAVFGALLAGTLVATPAHAAPVGEGFTVTPADLAYILKQIKIAEAHVASTTSATGPCGSLLGTGPNQLPSALLSMGLRTVDGTCNNLTGGQEKFGAADQLFPRLGGKDFKSAEDAPAGLFGPGSPAFATSYADKSPNNTVVDSQPRMISNLIADQTANNQAALAAAGQPVRSQSGARTPVAGEGGTLIIPNVTTDVGLSAPYNSWFTLFGQFFDHGVDQTVKGGGTVIVPLKADDPLLAGPDRVAGTDDDPRPGDPRYVPASMRFMALTRAANQPGPDGKLGTADDVQDARNTDTPFVDNSQTYASHPAHQVFLREYADDVQGRPVATGRLLGGAKGGLPTWADTKKQARELLGFDLTDADVLAVPAVLADAYGRFVPGPARGLPQYVTTSGLIEGDTVAPVRVPADVVHFDTPFLTDIAHNADPSPVDTDHRPDTPPVSPRPDDDHTASADFAGQPPGTYDDEMLDAHYIAGDGRVNENIGLTSIHTIFHSEHERLVSDIERVLTADGGTALGEWRLGESWNGERIFQAARFVNEMEYQHLVFEEFARKVQPAINPFQPFAFTQSELDPAVYAEFAHAVYRFGHSMLTETISRTAEDGTDNSTSLLTGFLNPPAFTDDGRLTPGQAAGEVVMGMSAQVGDELDEFMTDTLRNNLLGLPMDLAAVNITRGRSEGMPSLNNLRRTLHDKTNDARLAPYTSWVDFGENLKHPESLLNFVAAYGKHPTIVTATTLAAKRAAARAIVAPQPGDVVPDDAAAFMTAGAGSSGLDDVDLWIGGLAETTQPFGGLLGSTFDYVFETQLTRLQNGDRLYYLARTPGMNLRTQLEGNSFAELIMRNTTAHSLRADSFATSDCTFQLSHLLFPGGTGVADDPASQCDESALLIRMPDGTIKYRARNSVDRPGINGQSVYNGTANRDRVNAGNDNDTIWGNEDNDVLEGGAGNDAILGGAGDDTITDLGGDDLPKGGPGDDAIDAGPGLDIVNGGTGKDFTNGGANSNTTFAGEGDDFVIAGDGEDQVFGDSGDDWAEGGNSPDLLQGDSGNLFFLDDANKPGNDVLIGQGGDDDYDMEGGDDIGVQGPGVEKNAGGSGYDWSIAATTAQGGDDQPMDSDLNLPLAPLGILTAGIRDRYNELEALSGGKRDDILRGDDLTPSTVGGGGFLGCDALDATGIARIAGLGQVVTSLPTPAAAVGNQTGRPCDLHGDVWGEGNILLGGPGNDTIEGRGGDDIIDGDRYLSVRLSVRDADGTEIRQAQTMTELQADVFAGKINPHDIFTVREILVSPTSEVDTAVFSGNRAQYAIDRAGDTLTVSGPDGTDTVRNVEKLAFADQTVTVEVPAVTPDPATTVVPGTPSTPAIPPVTAVPTAPDAPGIGAATAGDATAVVRWTPPAFDGGSPVEGYEIQAIADQTGVVLDVDVAAADATELTFRGLTNDVACSFRVRAVNAAGASAFSPDSNAVTPADPRTVPGAPVIGAATAGDGRATARWTAPVADGGAAITGYDVLILTGSKQTVVRAAPDGAGQFVVAGLANGTAYRFQVRAVNAIGAGRLSLLSAPATPRTVPSTPTGLTAKPGAGGGSRTATLRWASPTSTGGAAITGYRVTLQALNANGTPHGSPAVSTVPAATRSKVFTAPVTGRYRCTVQAVNGAGLGGARTVFTTPR